MLTRSISAANSWVLCVDYFQMQGESTKKMSHTRSPPFFGWFPPAKLHPWNLRYFRVDVPSVLLLAAIHLAISGFRSLELLKLLFQFGYSCVCLLFKVNHVTKPCGFVSLSGSKGYQLFRLQLVTSIPCQISKLESLFQQFRPFRIIFSSHKPVLVLFNGCVVHLLPQRHVGLVLLLLFSLFLLLLSFLFFLSLCSLGLIFLLGLLHRKIRITKLGSPVQYVLSILSEKVFGLLSCIRLAGH